MVKYVYDAWGNHKVLDASGNAITSLWHIGHLNPFRYRGYYYDTETDLYYLKSRYYDPETGRFISPDDLAYVDPDNVNGTNLYTYCNNNPVMYVDNNGLFPISVISDFLSLIESALTGFGNAKIISSVSAFSDLANVEMYITDAFGGGALNPAYINGLSSATNLQYSGKVLSTLGKVAKVAGYVLLAIDIGLTIYDNATNPNLSTSRKVTDSIVDVGVTVASYVLAAKIGCMIGTFIPIPILGNLIGAVAGIAVGALINRFCKSPTYNKIKEGVNTFITKTIPNAWDDFVSGWNRFWSFSWI